MNDFDNQNNPDLNENPPQAPIPPQPPVTPQPPVQQYQQPVQQQQPYYQQQPNQMPPPVYSTPPRQSIPGDKKGMAIASMILGIAAILFSCTIWIGGICGIIGLILGCVSLKSSGKGMAIAGIITSAISLAIIVILFVFVFSAIGYSGGDWSYIFDYINNY